jgi:hypothetical protein
MVDYKMAAAPRIVTQETSLRRDITSIDEKDSWNEEGKSGTRDWRAWKRGKSHPRSASSRDPDTNKVTQPANGSRPLDSFPP